MLTKTPHLKRLREERLLSLRRLGKLAGVDPRTVKDLEEGTRAAQGVTIARLAKGLGVLPHDLTGREGVPEQQTDAFLEHLATEKKTYKPGDALYDSDLTAGLTDIQLAEVVRHSPELRAAVEAHLRLRRQVEHADEDRQRREAESQRDAG